ncbi:MAG: PhnD/SsuA/transferrin family substrate-binding protein [Pseudomonadota bacterium]
MIATLPMYDRPETRDATDRLWASMRAELEDAPETLSRDGYHWTDADLLFSQTCSLPYRTGLQDEVTVVATPVHDLPCAAGHYFSVILVRDDDDRADLPEFRGARLAINSPVSQSGWAAIDALARASDVQFESIFETGSHQASASAVAEGRADICAVDAVSWTMMERWDPFARSLRVITESPPSLALPYITAIERDPRPIQEALLNAVHALSDEDRKTLCLIDVTYFPGHFYASLPIPPTPPLEPAPA